MIMKQNELRWDETRTGEHGKGERVCKLRDTDERKLGTYKSR